jgi:hypothetical protein
MKKPCLAVLVLALTAPMGSVAAGNNAPPASGQAGAGEAGMEKMIRTESQQHINRNEPMPTGMAKKGMKKGDVKAHAQKKEAVMDEMMKKEEMKR